MAAIRLDDVHRSISQTFASAVMMANASTRPSGEGAG
jgi:hypothetical protein